MFLSLAFITWDPLDPAWSHSWKVIKVKNKGGLLGSYSSDLFFFLFGRSAWWLVIILFSSFLKTLINQIFNCIQDSSLRRYSGFFLLLIGSTGLEACFSDTFEAFDWNRSFFGNLILDYLFKVTGTVPTIIILVLFLICGVNLFFSISNISIKIFEFLYKLLTSINKKRDKRLKQSKNVKIQKNDQICSRRLNTENSKTSGQMINMPCLDLLDEQSNENYKIKMTGDNIQNISDLIESKLKDFGVSVSVVSVKVGPVVTCYEIEPAKGVKGSQIFSLSKDLARELRAENLRVTNTILGKNCMGIELPNPVKHTIKLSEILGSKAYIDCNSSTALALGQDIFGKAVIADLSKMPHLLLAGTTGSGKSVGLNSIILSLLYKASPLNIRLILIDPKMLEMNLYEGIPHLLTPIITDMHKARNALCWCIQEMEVRYKMMSQLGTRNLTEYNDKICQDAGSIHSSSLLPNIVVIIDELSDLVISVGKKIEELIIRLTQKARAAGIHLVLATQRPSVNVVTGLIKANIPARIAFQVSSKIDSRIILDQGGAENLLGKGDMLYLPTGSSLPTRIHGAFVSHNEISRVVKFLKEQARPNYIELNSFVNKEK